jgi:hypothetical protein
MRTALGGFAVLAIFLGSSTRLVSQGSPEWPQFRGPDRNGVAPVFSPPQVWPDQLTRKWKVDVGEGYATPILVHDRLYVFTRQGENEVMQALDAATGTGVWHTGYAAPFTVPGGAEAHGPGPKASPTFADVAAAPRLRFTAKTFQQPAAIARYDGYRTVQARAREERAHDECNNEKVGQIRRRSCDDFATEGNACCSGEVMERRRSSFASALAGRRHRTATSVAVQKSLPDSRDRAECDLSWQSVTEIKSND